MAEHNSTGTIERGIRRKPGKSGFEAYITVDGKLRSKYFPADAPIEEMRAWRHMQRSWAQPTGRMQVKFPPIMKVPPPPAGQTWIYFIDNEPFVKIGRSNNPVRRARVLQISQPRPARLIAVIAGEESLERELHERFRSSRKQGEWFTWTPELRSFVKTILNP
jgi:hypothetical protein